MLFRTEDLARWGVGKGANLTPLEVDENFWEALERIIALETGGGTAANGIASIADLTTAQQDEIGDGSLVTSTDGRRWVYIGSGAKTDEASYIELADLTPEWTVIAGKPATFPPSPHGHDWTGVTGRPATIDAIPVADGQVLVAQTDGSIIWTAPAASGLADAPADGTFYGRLDGAWSNLPQGAGSGLDADLLDGVQPSAFILGLLDDADAAAARATLEAAGLGEKTFGGTQTITDTSDAAGFGPQLNLERLSASPAASDSLGVINFQGKDSGGATLIRYVLRADGNGERRAEVRIGCAIGMGVPQTAAPGDPAYVDDGYAEPGWQVRTGEFIMPIAGEVAYSDPGGQPVADDGLDFFRLRPADVILTLDVINGEAAQGAVLGQRFDDIPAAVETLNAAFTEVVLDLKPLTGGPFETTYALAVTPLAVPRTLTL